MKMGNLGLKGLSVSFIIRSPELIMIMADGPN